MLRTCTANMSNKRYVSPSLKAYIYLKYVVHGRVREIYAVRSN